VFVFQNKFILVYLNKQARVSKLFDKQTQRSVIPEKQEGNVFALYEDIPMFWVCGCMCVCVCVCARLLFYLFIFQN
jgi:hypothetical protein